METKYKNGKIYKITDNGNNKCYYGSTINTLSKRFSGHKTDYKLYNNNNRTNITVFLIFNEYGIENCKIELVELYPCNNIVDLIKREGFYIKTNECVNKVIAGRTQKEYKEDNKEYYQEYFKKHYQENKAEILKYASEYRNKAEIKEKNKLYFKKYQQDNKEKLRAYNKAYREKKNEK